MIINNMKNFSYAFDSICTLKNILAIKEMDQNYDKFRHLDII
jgi:hypothetical protein